MVDKPRFKIDYYDNSYGPFGLFVWQEGLVGGGKWKHMDHWPTKEEAEKRYELIKGNYILDSLAIFD